MTPEQIAEQVAGARDRVRFDGGAEVPYDADQALVALADLVERHLESLRVSYEQQRRGHEPDIATIEALDATEIALSRAVRR